MKIFAFCLTISFSFTSYCQTNIIINGGFEDLKNNGSYHNIDPVGQITLSDLGTWEDDLYEENSNCFPGVNGGYYGHSPDWRYATDFGNNSSNGSVRMGTYELMEQNLSNPDWSCKSYTISFYLRMEQVIDQNLLPISLKVYLSKQKIKYKAGECVETCSPDWVEKTSSPDIQEIFSFPISLSAYPITSSPVTWYYVTQTVRIDLDPSYNWLAFELILDDYFEPNTLPDYGCQASYDIYLDDISLGLDCCPPIMLYQNTDYPNSVSTLPPITSVVDYIKAGNDVGAGTPPGIGPVTVFSGMNVTFNAGNYIDELPGFFAEPGALYDRFIIPCTNNNPISSIDIPSGMSIDCEVLENNSWPLFISGGTQYHIVIVSSLNNLIYERCDYITSNVINLWNGYCENNCNQDPDPGNHIYIPVVFEVLTYVLTITDCDGPHIYAGNLTLGLGGNCKFAESNTLDESKDLIYPVPCNDYFFISISNPSDKLKYSVSNIFGVAIAYGKLKNSETKIETFQWPSGVYIVSIYDSNDSLIKLFKEIKH